MSTDSREPDEVLSSEDETGDARTSSDAARHASSPDSPFADLPPRVERLVIDLKDGLDEALKVARERGKELLRKGRYTRVRLSFRGKEVITMPLTAFLAAEAVSILRLSLPVMILVNIIGKLSLTVEFINEAASQVEAGRAHLLDGDLDEALACFRQAVDMDPSFAEAHLRLGIALRMKGQTHEAKAAFERASFLDGEGEIGTEARKQIEKLERR